MDDVKKEKMALIMKQLEEGVSSVFTSENYLRLLQIMSQFHHYSFNNCILILSQSPFATRVASFQTWKKLGYPVKKGENGIRILVPIPYTYQKEKTSVNNNGAVVQETEDIRGLTFRIGTVFDISQVQGEFPSLANELEDNPQMLQTAVKRIISENDSIKYDFGLCKNSANGYYRLDTKEIFLRSDMSSLQTFKTLIHEKAHSLLHNSNSEKYTREEAEVQAESVAYIVSAAFGLNTSEYSFGYIASWSNGRELKELKSSLATIEKTAKEIMNWCTLHSDLEFVVPA